MARNRSAFFSIIMMVVMVSSLILVVPAKAANDGTNVFLQGTYLEVGIGPNGTFGSLNAPPAGFHTHGPSNLGFVADYQKDGWTVGTPPYGGDYFTPGNPWEGFGITCGINSAAQNNGGNGVFGNGITPISLTEGSGTQLNATWIGTIDICGSTLLITHHYYMNPTWTYIMVDTTIQNTGAATVDALTFGRGVDPDNDQTWPGGSFFTKNEVISQPGSIPDATSTKAILTAYGTVFTDMGLFLGTDDSRARANAALPSFSMYNISTLTSPAVGPITADRAMQIAYDLGALAAGNSVQVTYFYGFNVADMGTILGSNPHISGIDPVHGPDTGGTIVFINGTGLAGAGFSFGGFPATCTEVTTGTRYSCITPAHEAGPVSVVATSAGGNSVLPNGFTYDPSTLPKTGFAPGRITTLASQPADKAYAALGDLWLEIPRLGVKMNIVGVPTSGNTWDVSWLGNDAGWLNGSAFPTYAGNSVITGHVWNADNTQGPFASINKLWWGDQVIVHAWGGQYIYEVREVKQIGSGSVESVFQHKDLPWVTLLTCRGFNAETNTYTSRLIVRAVLVNVK